MDVESIIMIYTLRDRSTVLQGSRLVAMSVFILVSDLNGLASSPLPLDTGQEHQTGMCEVIDVTGETQGCSE